MAEWLLTGGRIADATGERTGDVRVVDGMIGEIGRGLAPGAGATVLDAEGCVIAPGLVDLQVHLREPGREDAETILREHGEILIRDDICNHEYRFTPEDVAELFSSEPTLH